MKVKVAHSCWTLCDRMDYGEVYGILQDRILEWVTMPFSRGSSQPRDWTLVSHIAGGFFTSWDPGELKSPCCTLQPENLFILHNWNFVPLDQHHSFPLLFYLWKKKNSLKYNHINNKVLLYSTRNSTQNLVIKHNGKEYEKNTYMFNWVTLL